MNRAIKHLALAASLFAAASTMAVTEAEARRGARTAGAVAGAVIGLGLLGAYAAERDRAYYRSCHPGPRVCDVVGQRCWHNRYGDYRCKDDVRCYTREICD